MRPMRKFSTGAGIRSPIADEPMPVGDVYTGRYAATDFGMLCVGLPIPPFRLERFDYL